MHIHSPYELATIIKDFRKQNQLSQQQVAELVGLKQATVSAFENNPERTKIDTLFRILAATNLQLTIQPRDQTPIIENEADLW